MRGERHIEGRGGCALAAACQKGGERQQGPWLSGEGLGQPWLSGKGLGWRRLGWLERWGRRVGQVGQGSILSSIRSGSGSSSIRSSSSGNIGGPAELGGGGSASTGSAPTAHRWALCRQRGRRLCAGSAAIGSVPARLCPSWHVGWTAFAPCGDP
eukprot:352835-Chlamydomonas_euryale.AAC.6